MEEQETEGEAIPALTPSSVTMMSPNGERKALVAVNT